jgi:hypothetical protein
MIDTLKLSKGLQKAGMTADQAEGIAEALNEAQTDYVTKGDLEAAAGALKKDLELAIERLRSELQRFILVSIVLVAIAQILVIKVWH